MKIVRERGSVMLINTIICFTIIILIILVLISAGYLYGRHVRMTRDSYESIRACKHPADFIHYIKPIDKRSILSESQNM